MDVLSRIAAPLTPRIPRTPRTPGTTGIPALRPPSLENQSASEWALHREVAYYFARHARHDIINVQCALQLMEVVETMRQMGSDIPLPPELQPDQVALKVKQSITQMVSMMNDQVLLSQAATPGAYTPARMLSLKEIWDNAVTSRLGKQQSPSALLPASPGAGAEADARVVVLGDMLPSALAVCFFQWTPGLQPLSDRPSTLEGQGREITLTLPVVDPPMVRNWADKLARRNETEAHPVLREPRTTPTAEMALWIARFIILLHGGAVAVVEAEGTLLLEIRLPRV